MDKLSKDIAFMNGYTAKYTKYNEVGMKSKDYLLHKIAESIPNSATTGSLKVSEPPANSEIEDNFSKKFKELVTSPKQTLYKSFKKKDKMKQKALGMNKKVKKEDKPKDAEEQELIEQQKTQEATEKVKTLLSQFNPRAKHGN